MQFISIQKNDKCMKGSIKNKESSHLMQWDATNLYGLKFSQKLPVENLE